METAKCTVDREMGSGRSLRRKPVLVVESDFKSAVMFGRVFRDMGMLEDLVIAVDCENALRRLHEANGALPGLILLDTKMPRMSAMGFLRLLKEDAAFRMVPVVMLADSNDAEAVTACYDHGAAGYLLQSGDYPDVLDKMRAICAYWSLSRLPGEH